MSGPVGTCQSLAGAFFVVGGNYGLALYKGDGLIGGVLQIYHASSNGIML